MFFGSKKLSDGPSKDWADQAADAIQNAIDGLHDKAVVPLTTIARAIVYGVLAAIVGVAAAVIFAILLTRIGNVYLGNLFHFNSVVWLSDLIIGTLFVAGGLFFWSKRHPKAQ